VLRALGLKVYAGNYTTLRRRVVRLGLDTSHWEVSRASFPKCPPTPPVPVRTHRGERAWRDIPDAELMTAVLECRSAAQVIKRFELPICGNNYNRVQERVRRLGLDTSHWRRNRPYDGRPVQDYLREGVVYLGRTKLKQRILKAGLLRNECYECGQGPEWCGRPLVLVLDHVNGVADDWRPENLRMLCPNCNAQQPTFGGRNATKRRRRASSDGGTG
jgi:5-methylcytosine-specific restriction endonuclease McrA